MAEKAEEAEIEVEDGIGPISPAAAMAIGVRKGRSAGAKSDPKLDAFLDEQTRLVRLQTEHLHEQRELQLAHLRVRRWKDRNRGSPKTGPQSSSAARHDCEGPRARAAGSI